MLRRVSAPMEKRCTSSTATCAGGSRACLPAEPRSARQAANTNLIHSPGPVLCQWWVAILQPMATVSRGCEWGMFIRCFIGMYQLTLNINAVVCAGIRDMSHVSSPVVVRSVQEAVSGLGGGGWGVRSGWHWSTAGSSSGTPEGGMGWENSLTSSLGLNGVDRVEAAIVAFPLLMVATGHRNVEPGRIAVTWPEVSQSS